MGGAWMLAGACDLRIATASLRIGLTPARIGIVFPASGVESLVRLVGPVQAHKPLVRRAARGEDAPAVFGTDEISEALFRQVLDGPDARIGQQAFLARTKPAFRWSGEDFWAGRGGPARTGRGHRVSLIRGRRQRRSSGLRP